MFIAQIFLTSKYHIPVALVSLKKNSKYYKSIKMFVNLVNKAASLLKIIYIYNSVIYLKAVVITAFVMFVIAYINLNTLLLNSANFVETVFYLGAFSDYCVV